jgi:predicted TIM-barrel fold metal-dependent hydrolase
VFEKHNSHTLAQPSAYFDILLAALPKISYDSVKHNTGMRSIDAHQHVGSLEMNLDRSVSERVDKHVEMMDRNDISASVILAPGTYKNPEGLEDTRKINNDLAKMRDMNRDRFFAALGTVEPSYGEKGLEEIDRILTDLDLDGVMWHNRWQRSYANSDIMYRFVERASDHDAVVLLHAIADSKINAPWRVFEMIENFPDTQFIVVDAFSGASQSAEVIERAQDVDNVVFDTGLCYSLMSIVESFVDSVGADQLVLGTDFYTDKNTLQAMEVETIMNAEISKTSKEKILHENLERIFA